MSKKIEIETKEKAGWKTSEFWLTLLVVLVGYLMASGAFGEDHLVMRVAGLVAMTLKALGYTAGRVNAKRAASAERIGLGKPQAAAPPSE